jgi:malonyl-CoA O-methyltransferase
MSDAPFKLDQAALRRSFNRASASYDGAAQLQRAVRDELLSRVQYFKLQPRHVLDLGAGTGAASISLRRRYKNAAITAIDVAPQMLLRSGRRQWPWRRFQRACADARALPLASNSVDLIFSSLMLQWCDDPLPALAEMQRVLRPGGVLLLSSFGPQTLHELRAAWASVDSYAHVSEFPGLPQLAAALSRAGFSEPVLDVEARISHYASIGALAAELRAIGARNASADRPRGLTTRAQLQRLTQSYEQWRGSQGLPATYEIVYGAAFAGDFNSAGDSSDAGSQSAALNRRSASGEILVPIAGLRRRGNLP